ncbi:MAG TPA: transglycosylase domain-containing protein [Gaiellaceae bacterium]|nr:transglycosylase domain-containing protein [Gaiellaceae bacterium]
MSSHRRDDAFLLRRVLSRRRRRGGRKAKGTALVTAGVILTGVIVFVFFGASEALSATCNLNSLRPVDIGANTFVYASDGSLLGSIPADRNREPVADDQISPYLPQATIAIEDRRFYKHGGVDYFGIARAAWSDLTAGKVVQGGSTITQQLVRNLYTGSERTFRRKIKEACLAIKLSDKWSKQKILNEYENTVYYGNHAYGIEAAAQTYFSEHASDLTLPQAALLAGLPQAPSDYDPFHNPDGALGRRNEVLLAMFKSHDITQQEYDRSVQSRDLGLKAGRIYTSIKEPYFFSYVTDRLEQEYGANTVREGGLKVYTTIDPKLQYLAKKAMRDILPYKTDPAAAIVSIVPGTGEIRAMTALSRNSANQFNLVAQSGRQAGSTFKSFVLASAIELGIDPDSSYYTSAPFTCTASPWCSTLDPWNVHTYSYSYLGSVSVTQATLASDNTVYAQLTLDVGPTYVWKMAHRLGVHMAPDKPVASIGLGSLAVSPLDMAAAYATFSALGVYAKPRAITKVVLPDGRVDSAWGKAETHRVLSQGVAWKVNQILAENALYGTGAGSGDGIHPNAGKTGTTDNHADAWFDGYTRQLATVVWMGYPSGEIPMVDVHGVEVAGATFPVPMWHEYMAAALKNQPALQFGTPSSYPTWRYYIHGVYGYLGAVATSTTTTTTTTPTTTAPERTVTRRVTTTIPPPVSTTTTTTAETTTTTEPTTTEPPPPPPTDTTTTETTTTTP